MQGVFRGVVASALTASDGLVTRTPYPRIMKSKCLLLLAVLAGIACSGDGGGPSSGVDRIDVSGTTAVMFPSQTTYGVAAPKDRQGKPIAAVTISWTSDNPSVVEVSPTGLLQAVSSGVAQISAQGGGRTGTVEVTVSPTPSPPLPGQPLDGRLLLPSGVDPEAAFVGTGWGAAARIAGDGTFTLVLPDSSPTLLLGYNGDSLFSLTVAQRDCGEPILGPRSTAIALIFMRPPFADVPHGLTCELIHLLDSLPTTTQLANALTSGGSGTGHLPVTTDGQFALAYRTAVTAALHALTALRSAPAGIPRAQALSVQACPPAIGSFPAAICGSGLTALPMDNTTTIGLSKKVTISLENAYGRDALVFVLAASPFGQPAVNQGSLTNLFADPYVLLPPADYVPNFFSLSDWQQAINGTFGTPTSQSIQITFTPAQSRYLLYAYGLGFAGGSTDRAFWSTAESQRLAPPVLGSVIFRAVFPTANLVAAIPQLKPTSSDLVQLAAIFGYTQDVTELLNCLLSAGSDPNTGASCLWNLFLGKLQDPAVMQQFQAWLLRVGGQNLSQSVVQNIAKTLLTVAKISSMVDAVGDLAQLGYAAVSSQSRQELDVGYNALLGGTRIVGISGDLQQGTSGSTLPADLVVQVTDATAHPVQYAWISWSSNTNGGASSQAFSETDGQGLARVRWTLGTATTPMLTATLAGTTQSTTFSTRLLGQVGGSVTSPQRGALANVTVSVTPNPQSTITGSNGAYALNNVPAGPVALSLSNLPPGCTNPGSRQATVPPNASALPVNFSVTCSTATGALAGVVFSPSRGRLAGVQVTTSGVTTTTNGTGSYLLPYLYPGNSQVTLSGLPSSCTEHNSTWADIIVGSTARADLWVDCPGNIQRFPAFCGYDPFYSVRACWNLEVVTSRVTGGTQVVVRATQLGNHPLTNLPNAALSNVFLLRLAAATNLGQIPLGLTVPGTPVSPAISVGGTAGGAEIEAVNIDANGVIGRGTNPRTGQADGFALSLFSSHGQVFGCVSQPGQWYFGFSTCAGGSVEFSFVASGSFIATDLAVFWNSYNWGPPTPESYIDCKPAIYAHIGLPRGPCTIE